MIQKRTQWLMSHQQYKLFTQNRKQSYKQICHTNQIQQFPDEKLLQYYTWNMVCFLRTRKYPIDRPFKFQKVIYTAVCLFKRYFLINSFIDQEPMQLCICAMYLSLKINQYPIDYIHKMVKAWKGKQVLEAKRGHYHYGQQGYAEIQFKLLNGIGFQTVRSKMIHTIQSLYGKTLQIEANNLQMPNIITKNQKVSSQLLYEIKQNLQKIYISPQVMFLEDGCKLALAVYLISLEKIKYLQEVNFQKTFGQKFLIMLKTQKQQIQSLKDKVVKLETYNEQNFKENKTEFYRKLTKVHYKKPQFKKSPRFHARHDSFIQS